MNKNLTLNDNNIGKLLVKLSVPAMIGMLVMSLYNVVDAVFIGQSVGTAGIGGVAISFPIQMIVGAIGQMLGIGGASLLSRSLGEGNMDKAGKTLGNVIAGVTVSGLIITALGYSFMDPMLRLFGATHTLLPYAREYMVYILAGITFHILAMALNNLARAEGKAHIAMTTMIVSAVLNIILDAVFILGLNMGIRGAAIATLISYIVAALFLLIYFLSGKSVLKLRLKDIHFTGYIQKEILSIGISSFIRQTSMSLLVVLLNNKLGQLGGDISIAVYGVVMRLVMLIFTPIMGIAQGLQPIVGFNFGAGKYGNMRKAVKLAMISSTFVAVVGTFLLAVFPDVFLKIFSNDSQLVAQGRVALRFLLLAFPLVGFQVMGTILFQATGKAAQTLLLTLSRQIIFLIPLVLILPRFFQVNGIWGSFPIADVLSSALTLWMLVRYRDMYRLTPGRENEADNEA